MNRFASAILAVCLALVFLLPHNAHAGYVSGAFLFEASKHYENSKNDSTEIGVLDGFFRGYVMGVVDGSPLYETIPDDLTTEDICDIVATYLQKHPEQAALAARTLVFASLSEGF